MSVLARKRTLSRYEYAYHFVKLYEYTEERLSKMAKRKHRWIGEPIADQMNAIRDDIMQAFDEFYGDGTITKKKCTDAIRGLLKLQKPLLALWNIERYTDKRMIKWVSLIDREINLLADKAGLTGGRRYMYILDYAVINRMECMRNISALHKTIYTKAISLPAYCRATKGSYLMRTADEALFCIFEGNRIIPDSKEAYEKREKYLSRSLNCLKAMEQPLFAVFNLMDYKSETMEEIAKMITEEEKLIIGLMKSDRKKFSQYTG